MQVLTDRLLAAAEVWEDSYVDPYSSPMYDIQIQKIHDKAAREAARAAAAEAKAERWV